MLSPLDDRYFEKVRELHDFFSEDAQLKFKTRIEIEYFIALCEELKLPLTQEDCQNILDICNDIQPVHIKVIEEKTKHDIKAIEYYLRQRFKNYSIPYDHMIHFGLTSQDINSVCTSIQLTKYNDYLSLFLWDFVDKIKLFGKNNDCVFPARTHGQLAVPTLFSKEINVFVNRLTRETIKLTNYKFNAKFGGAVGNLSAHYLAYPEIDWEDFANTFLDSFDLSRSKITTQVDNNASISEYFDIIRRINNIFIDFCKDMWMYISYGYFTQAVTEEEIGSSTMPQKINPINFENAEGNLEFANSIFHFMSDKLQISRMQRDLSDTTVIRNLGVPFGHSMVAYKSILTGLERSRIDQKKVDEDLSTSKTKLLAEAYQTLLRKYNIKDAYELIKSAERDGTISIQDIGLPDELLEQINSLKPEDYVKHLKDKN